MGNGPQKVGLWNSPEIPLVVYSSTGIPKKLCMGNGPQKEGWLNFPGIPLVFHSFRGGLEEDLLFRRSRGILLNWSCGMNFLAGQPYNPASKSC